MTTEAIPGRDGPILRDGLGRSGSRRLLARLRDVMAGATAAQQRLDDIVRLIAAETGADVCSCYIRRAGEVLELFATVGLNPEAVHRTRLRVGEGLVGDIAAHARPLALADAPSHPNFAYRPETGEDPYRSLLGVPILRGGRVRGVLVLQHQEERAFVEEEVETLQTVAMVVAELVGTSDLVSAQEISTVADAGVLPTRLEGTTLNRGLAMGLAVLHRPQISIRQMVSDDPEIELERLTGAVANMHSAIDDLLRVSDVSGEYRDILETYRMFAADRGWLARIREAILNGLTAEAAVQQVQNDTRVRMGQMSDPYIRERLLDLEDLTNRLLLHLAGRRPESENHALPDDVVLVARSMGPAELLDYDRTRLRGLVLEEGSASSHVAIVARALDIPVVGQCKDLLNRIEPLDPLVVDGDHGQIFVRPAEDIQEACQQSIAMRAERQRLYAELATLPAVTRDGVPVSLQLNCGLEIDVANLAPTGADGIGLYRTEIPFMVRPVYPDVGSQTRLYARVLDQAGGRPVVFRTLDIGGDKRLPYFADTDEENPALGWRAIRIGLDRPVMLRKQLRALLHAAAGRELRVMFPMVAEVSELAGARRLLDMEVARARRDGTALPQQIRVGVMMEVPSLLWQLPALLPQVDFVSVGSNDLLQYLFASDRGNPRIGNRYDTLAPAFLSVLKSLARSCADAGVSLSVCGEMAGRPLDAMALIGVGITTLSMAPTAVGPVKTMVRSLDVRQLRQYLANIERLPDHSLREKLRDFALDHGVVL